MKEREFVFTSASTGERIDLPRESEDQLIAIALWLLKDAMVLESEVVYENVLDAEEIG